MTNHLVSVYLAEMERRLTAPSKFRRTMSDRDFFCITIPLSVIAGGGIAALSFVISIPGLS